MKKIYLKKSLVILISAVILTAGIALACASDWNTEYGTSNFTPEVFVKEKYSPFFYSAMFYYKIDHDESQRTRFNLRDDSDWAAYLNQAIPLSEMDLLLHKTGTATVDSVSKFFSGKSAVWPSSLGGLTVQNFRTNDKVVAMISYLRLAKMSETFACNEIQYAWEIDTTKKIKKYNAGPLNEELKNGFLKSTDIYLKERYWFQLARSYYFNGSLADVSDLFGNNEKSMPKNAVYWRALSYVAGAYYKKKQYGRANYYYSLVYENCDLLKTTAHYSFHPQAEKDWKITLSLCRNKGEKATLWQMLGVFYADEKRSIEEIYRLDPKNEKLNLLLARAVNIYEQKFNNGNDYVGMPQDTTNHYEDSLKKLMTRIAQTGNTDKPWIWNMAVAYLHMVDLEYTRAIPFLNQAAKTLPADKLAREQLRLLKFINRVGLTPLVDAKFENESLRDMQWLKSFGSSDTTVFRTQAAYEWMKQTFAREYKKQGEFAKSECFASHTTFYADAKNTALMKAFLSKPAKTAYEQFCISISPIKLEDIYEYEGIQLAYADSLDAAILKMEKATGGASHILAGNPFNARINDCHDCDFAAPQKVKYSKLSFLKKMKELKDKISRGEDSVTNATLLANAFYNMSQYGNARLFYECKILGGAHFEPDMIELSFRPMIVSMENAEKYYQLALSSARTDEQKAKCEYLLAKCQRNRWYTDYIFTGSEVYDAKTPSLDFRVMDGFKALEQYSNTQYYKDVIKECGYFRDYLKR
jgi:hypothetical protein